MKQQFLEYLDLSIYYYGLAPDFIIRIAFIILYLHILVITGFLLYLLFIPILKKNLNFLKKENIKIG